MIGACFIGVPNQPGRARLAVLQRVRPGTPKGAWEMTHRKTGSGLIFAACLLAAGCGSGYRACSQFSVLSMRKPVMFAGWTNAVPEAAGGDARGPLAVSVPVGAPVQVYAEQVIVMLWGGTAASNSVLSGIEIPLVK